MFNVNPSRMWRNKNRYNDKSTTRKIPFFKKRPKPVTHKASQKRRAKARMKNKIWGIDEI